MSPSWILIVAISAHLGGSLTGPPSRAQSATWRMVELDLEIVPLPFADMLSIEGRMIVELLDGTSTGPDLVLGEQVRFREVHVISGADQRARVNQNLDVPDLERGVVTEVRFKNELEPNTRLEIEFVCESESEGSQLQVSEDVAFASWVEGWYPFPRNTENSYSKQMSTVGTTTFHLPPGWDAVSNGTLIESEKLDEGSIITWRVDAPVARSFSAAPYRTVRHKTDGREVGVYLLPGTDLDVTRQAELLSAALAAQEERFGPYPYASYAIAEVPPGDGFYASSEQGFIMARTGAFAWDHGNLPLWGHEMAHGWWGNLVGTQGDGSILCSESLAQYSAVVAIEAIEGKEAATEFLRFSRSGYSPTQCARGYFEMARAGKDMPLAQLGSGGWMHNLADAKGHWVYHMLRRRIGDEFFFTGLRTLIEQFSGARMSLNDLRQQFIDIAPDADLEVFFAQWLDRPGAPVLEASWSDLENGRTELVITQVQEGESYMLELDVEIASEGEPRRESLHIESRETRIELEGLSAISSVELDPDHALLIWQPEYGK